MPLYMDIHTVDSETFTVEDVVKAHMEDLAIQDQFEVKQLKYWVNEKDKMIFCLMEGPDKEACNQVHLQSHGNTACNIIEVSDNEYDLFMGLGTAVSDLAQTPSGELDTGFRTLLLVNLACFNGKRDEYAQNLFELVKQNDGMLIIEPGNEFMVSFVYASNALACAQVLSNYLQTVSNKIAFTISVSSGLPVDEHGNKMFEETKKKVRALCSLGLANKTFIDGNSFVLAGKENPSQQIQKELFTEVSDSNLSFILKTTQLLSEHLANTAFNSSALITDLGLSKSQVYRKVKSLTGLAPNQLVQDSRLVMALNLLAKKELTIAEVAYSTGFNSPSYFTRAFKKRFSISPTEYL